MNPSNATPESEPSDAYLTVGHRDHVFERQSIYLSGHSYEACVFRQCTLIVKDLARLGLVRNCQFENCVWHLNVTIHDRNAWQTFLSEIAPAITYTLPQPAP